MAGGYFNWPSFWCGVFAAYFVSVVLAIIVGRWLSDRINPAADENGISGAGGGETNPHHDGMQ